MAAAVSSPIGGLGLNSDDSETVLVTREQYEFLLKTIGETGHTLQASREQNQALRKEIKVVKDQIADAAGNNDDNGVRIDRDQKEIKKLDNKAKKLTCGDICIKILMIIAGLILACLAIL